MNAEIQSPLDDLVRRIGVYLEQDNMRIDPDAHTAAFVRCVGAGHARGWAAMPVALCTMSVSS